MSSNILEPQKILSPSSINTYLSCPRNYFYSYIAKIKVKPNIHLIKGGVVHEALEYFFKYHKKDMAEHMKECFEKAWNNNEQNIKDLELAEDKLSIFRSDILFMLNEYLISFRRKVDALIQAEKAENSAHAWFLLRPKFRELYVKDEKLKCCGFIDRVSEDFNGILTIGDYKTSSKYGIGLPEEYKRQLAIYSLLYQSQNQRTPDFAGVIFLRYGEEYLVEVTPSLLMYARNTILGVYNKTRSTVLNDYPKHEGSRCRWCSYTDICSGKEKWEESLRKQRLEVFIKKREEENVTKKKENNI